MIRNTTSLTADEAVAPQGKATQQSRETTKKNFAKQPALSSPNYNGHKVTF